MSGKVGIPLQQRRTDQGPFAVMRAEQTPSEFARSTARHRLGGGWNRREKRSKKSSRGAKPDHPASLAATH